MTAIFQFFQQDSRLWSRVLVVPAVLLASAYLAPRASLQHLTLILGSWAIAAFVRWPPLGLAALVVSTLIVPLSIGTGTQTGLNVTALLLFLLIGLWLLSMMGQRNQRLLPSRPILPLLAFVSVATLSLAVGNEPLIAFAKTAPLQAQIGGLGIFILSAGAFLLAGHQLHGRWLQVTVWLFLILGAFYLSGRLVPSLSRFVSSVFQRGADGSLFWVWVVTLSFSQALFNTKLRLPWRLALAGLGVGTLAVGILQGKDWTSGWLPALVALIVTLLVGKPRFALVVLLGAGVLAVSRLSTIDSFMMGGDNEYSMMTRLEAWRILLEIIKSSPLVGVGPANYYWYTPIFSILGYHVNFNSHNNYIDILAQTGLLGMACFLWFAWELYRLGWKLRTKLAAGFEQAYVRGALGGLAGTLLAGMLGDWVLPFVYNVGYIGFRASVLGWIFLGGLMAIELENRRPPDSPAQIANNQVSHSCHNRQGPPL